MAEPINQIEQTRSTALQELTGVKNAEQLEQFRIKYLGSNGQVKGLMTLLKTAPREQKPLVGQKVNSVRDEITAAFEACKAQLAAGASEQAEDITEPGLRPRIGNLHVLNKVRDELVELFGRMGFSVASGPEVEDEYHNFVALNIPASHPARDPLDNYYLSDSHLLRTQTSTVQIRVMETQKPPIRVVIPGRVYRPDTHDETHLSMFHQIEALVVDKGVTMVDLKSTILQFIHAYFGKDSKVRFRPSFFPFTEPSAEVDVWFEDKGRWIEAGGCGMVHPNVLRGCKIDPEIYSGWAFGFGIDRIAMRKYNVKDIRDFVANDVRFLRQF